MSLNLTNLFTAWGRAGREAYLLNQTQVLASVPFNELAALAYVQPEWITALATTYDGLIRQTPIPMPTWAKACANIAQGMVALIDPSYAESVATAIQFVYQQMLAQSASVLQCSIGESVTPNPANVGNGGIFITTQRADGQIWQNTINEITTLSITADSYTGGATVGREPWTWAGAPNISSLGTGVACALWDYDWPQGSNVSISGNAISSAQDAAASGNLLTNGDFETWAGSPLAAANWNAVVGTWGTNISKVSGGIDGGFCAQFATGATLTQITQQFGSTATTGATAGTVPGAKAYQTYAVSLWLKAAGVVSGGVLTVSLVDGSNVVINDQGGTPNSTTIALTAAPTVWTNHLITFRTPTVIPSTVRLSIGISTALAGADILLDAVCFAAPSACYLGGPSIAVFSNPAAPFVFQPNPDNWTLTFTNDYAGATDRATWQMLFLKLFQTPGMILPYSGSPTLADSLIVGV